MRIDSPANGATVSGAIAFTAVPSNGTLKSIDFLVDGAWRWNEKTAPYRYGGDTGFLDTTKLADGAHTLAVKANFTGRATARASVGVVVKNAAQAPTEPAPTPTPDPVVEPNLTPTWLGGFETNNLSQFMQYIRVNSMSEPGNRITLPTSPSLDGRAVRFELRPGDVHNGMIDTTTGLSYSPGDSTSRVGIRARRDGKTYFTKGDDVYMRFAVYIDPSTTIGSGISNPWRTLVSLAGGVEDGSFSPLKLSLHREANGGASSTGTDALVINGDLGVDAVNDQTAWVLQNPQKGAWYEFATHWKFSDVASEGLVEFWLKKPGDAGFSRITYNRGQLNGQTSARIRTLDGATHRAQQRWGIYRNKSFATTDVIYYDKIMWGASASSIGLG